MISGPMKSLIKKKTLVFFARSRPVNLDLPRVSTNSTREPLLSQNKLLTHEKAF